MRREQTGRGTSGRDRAPFGSATASFDLHETFRAHLAQDVTHHVSADAGAVMLEVRDAERTKTARDRTSHLIGLGSLECGDAHLEFVVSSNEHAPEIVEPGMGVVLVGVPRPRTSVERVIVGLARFLDDALEAHVAPYLVVEVIQEQQREKLPDASVPITERMDAQEVEDRERHEDERVGERAGDGGMIVGSQICQGLAAWSPPESG